MNLPHSLSLIPRPLEKIQAEIATQHWKKPINQIQIKDTIPRKRVLEI